MISNILMLPFISGTLLFLYLAWTVDNSYAGWMIPCLVISALIYILKPEIDWWWHNKRPPRLPDGVVRLLERFCAFYQKLDANGQQRFRDRVALFQMGTDWMPMAWQEDELPGDVLLAISTQAVILTWNKPVFLFEKFEKIIVYPLAFPTLNYQFLHASELHEEDGCILFSAQHLMEGFLKPGQFYNVALHEYAKAFAISYPAEPWPDFNTDDVWTRLETASGMSRAHVEQVIGLSDVAALPVAIHHYFTFPEQFRSCFEKEYATFQTIFG